MPGNKEFGGNFAAKSRASLLYNGVAGFCRETSDGVALDEDAFAPVFELLFSGDFNFCHSAGVGDGEDVAE